MIDTHLRHFVQPAFDAGAAAVRRTGVTPDQVTVAAFTLGLVTGPMAALGHPVWAVALLWLSGALDALDGSLARMSKRSSAWGTTMDIVFDRLVEISVMLGLASRFPASRLPLLWLMGAIIFSITVFLTVGALAKHRGYKSFYYQAGLMERTEGFVLFSLMLLLSRYLVLLTWLFVLVEAFTGLQRLAEAHRVFSQEEQP